jgi:WD40 repeat protein
MRTYTISESETVATIGRKRPGIFFWYLLAMGMLIALVIALIVPKSQLFPSFAKPQTVISADNAHEIRLIASLTTRWSLDVIPQFSRDNRVMLLPDIDGVHVWDLETGKERYSLHEPDACSNGICNPNGYYDVKNFGGNTFRYALSPDGKLAAVAFNRGKLHDLRIWNIETGQLVRSLERHKGLRGIIFSPDSKLLIYDSEPDDMVCSGLCAWNVETDEISLIDPLSPFDDWLVLQLQFMPDEVTLVYSAYQVKTYNFTTGEQRVMTANEGAVFAFASDAEYSRIAIINGGYERPGYSVIVWDTHTMKQLFEVVPGVVEEVWDVQFDPNGLWFATAGEIQIWDAEAGTMRTPLEHSSVKYRQNFVVSPNGQVIAAWAYDGDGRGRYGVGLWDTETGKNLTIVNGGDYLTRFAFSPDGTMLVSANGMIYGIQ